MKFSLNIIIKKYKLFFLLKFIIGCCCCLTVSAADLAPTNSNCFLCFFAQVDIGSSFPLKQLTFCDNANECMPTH